MEDISRQPTDAERLYQERSDRVVEQAIYEDRRIKNALIAMDKLKKYKHLFDAADKKYGLPPGTMISIAAVESGGRDKYVFGPSKSSASAAGIVQLKADPARSYGLRVDDEVDERFDPEKAIDAGAQAMAKKLKRYDGHIETALADYNAGNKYVRDFEAGKGSLPEGTRQYIGTIPTVMELIQQPERQVFASSRPSISPKKQEPSSTSSRISSALSSGMPGGTKT
tara:strand:+ start:528 stop:1202 length:675 start_codon:yes stop_codon:yes gene_type:complete